MLSVFPVFVKCFQYTLICFVFLLYVKFSFSATYLLDLSYMRHNLKVKEADLVCSYMHEKLCSESQRTQAI